MFARPRHTGWPQAHHRYLGDTAMASAALSTRRVRKKHAPSVRHAWRSTMSGIQELFELGQTILSTVGVTLFLEMLIYVLYLHPQSPYVLKSYCTAWRRRVSNFVSSGSYEKFFFRRLLLPLLSFVSPYSYDSCAALKALQVC